MSITRWTPRRVARVVAAGVIVVAMGLASGAESSAGEPAAGRSRAGGQAGKTTLTYVCPFPSGAQRITVTIAGTFPGTTTVGHPVRLGDVTMTPALPRAALAGLTELDATSVAASARMSVTVVRKNASTTTTWSSLAASTPIPRSGDLALHGPATVPPVAAGKAGPVVLIAGELTLDLTPRKADGGATDPAAIPLDCELRLGPSAILATVMVTGPAGVAPPSATGTRHTAGKHSGLAAPCPVHVPNPPTPGEAYMAGFSNVDKLHGATLLGVEDGETTGHVLLELAYTVIIDPCTPGVLDVLSRGQLDHHGEHALPPAKATFLTFGFMPTTATLELTEPAGTDLEIDSHSFFDGTAFQEKSTVVSQLSIRIHDVLVNGQPLDVGPHCESATPMTVTLVGNAPDYTVNTGGPLTGTATIPPFSGCGVGEDLDPLFTASISGPGNFMKLIQGVPCTHPINQPPLNCDPVDRPKPRP